MMPIEEMSHEEIGHYISRLQNAMMFDNLKELPKRYRGAEMLIQAGIEMMEREWDDEYQP